MSDPRTRAIIVLAAALLGSISGTPSIYLPDAIGLALLFGGVAFVVCLLVTARRARRAPR